MTNQKIHLTKRALYLQYFTVFYNIIEAVVSIVAGYLSGNISLVGFGFDSVIESISGCVLIWRFSHSPDITKEKEALVEQKAVKLVGISFFVLGGYVLTEAILNLVNKEIPEPTLVGIVVATLSIIIMPVLARMKRKTGKGLNSSALVADSKQTDICAYLSVILLTGLTVNFLFGLWWVDSAAAIMMAFIIFKEGFETLKTGKTCSGCCS